MTGYRTTLDFIHICAEEDRDKRISRLEKNLGVKPGSLSKHKPMLNTILDFIKEIDGNFHRLDRSAKRTPFLSNTLHSHISSDLRSMIVLALAHQNYQLNIVLRHFIECFVVTLWGDLSSGFTKAFDYLLADEEWKPYREKQRITWEPRGFPNRSIKERLERIRLLNWIDREEKEFYKYYFANATECDLIILLALPICQKCMDKNNNQINYVQFHLDPEIRKLGKEDKHAVFRSDFGYVCYFCGRQKVTEGIAFGIPEAEDMLEMLKSIIDNSIVLNIAMLQRLYSYLSEDYVHFASTTFPDQKPQPHEVGGKPVLIWGLDGILYCIEILKPAMAYYYRTLQEVKAKEKTKHIKHKPMKKIRSHKR